MSKRRRQPSLVPGQRPSGSSRPIQVGEAVRQAIGTMLSEGAIKDPRLSSAMVTVTDVEMTPDLKLARVYVSVFPEDDELMKGVIKGLRSAANHIKRELSARLELRYTPTLSFGFDKSIAQGARIEALIHEIHAGDKEPSS
jgi:ribosome-binding factor A